MNQRPLILIGKTTQVLTPESYVLEEKLQALLEDHPEILWLGEVSDSAPKLVTIGREVQVPSGAIDLLLLGGDGVLVLVETKLKKNQEARRTVVAQLLEYASYLDSWTLADVERTIRSYSAAEPFEELSLWLESHFDRSGEELVADLATALSEGRTRLVIAVDEMPEALKSLITFVNRRSTFKVLVLQLASYPSADDEQVVVVPDLFGYVPAAPQTGTRWDSERFFYAIPADCQTSAKELQKFAVAITGREVEWGTGRDRGSFTARLITAAGRFSLFSVYTTGELSLNIGWNHQRLEPGLTERYRSEAGSRLSLNFSERTWLNGWPMATLAGRDETWLRGFENLAREFVQELKA